MTIEKEKLLHMYRSMVRHREFEQSVQKEFAAGKIPGFVHLSIGQEAIPTGALSTMRPDDYFSSEHRAHGYLIVKGDNTGRLMAELYGKKTGIMKGKGGSMHFNNIEFNSLGNDGLLGTHLVTTNGVALSFKIRGTDQVVLCTFGDGIINTERFHTGVNLASVWKLPVVYICLNNTWAETTSIYDTMNLTKISDRACGYGIPGVTIDGNDVIAVYETVAKAVERARKGDGPTFIECQTCRWRGHFEGDAQAYRREGEIEQCMKKDPIPRFRKKLIEMGVLTEEEADRIHQEALEEMDKAVKFAEESPYPEAEELLTDVYA